MSVGYLFGLSPPFHLKPKDTGMLLHEWISELALRVEVKHLAIRHNT